MKKLFISLLILLLMVSSAYAFDWNGFFSKILGNILLTDSSDDPGCSISIAKTVFEVGEWAEFYVNMDAPGEHIRWPCSGGSTYGTCNCDTYAALCYKYNGFELSFLGSVFQDYSKPNECYECDCHNCKIYFKFRADNVGTGKIRINVLNTDGSGSCNKDIIVIAATTTTTTTTSTTTSTTTTLAISTTSTTTTVPGQTTTTTIPTTTSTTPLGQTTTTTTLPGQTTTTTTLQSLCGNGILDSGEVCDIGKEGYCDGCEVKCVGPISWVCNDNCEYEEPLCDFWCPDPANRRENNECSWSLDEDSEWRGLAVGETCAPGKVCNEQCQCVNEELVTTTTTVTLPGQTTTTSTTLPGQTTTITTTLPGQTTSTTTTLLGQITSTTLSTSTDCVDTDGICLDSLSHCGNYCSQNLNLLQRIIQSFFDLLHITNPISIELTPVCSSTGECGSRCCCTCEEGTPEETTTTTFTTTLPTIPSTVSTTTTTSGCSKYLVDQYDPNPKIRNLISVINLNCILDKTSIESDIEQNREILRPLLINLNIEEAKIFMGHIHNENYVQELVYSLLYIDSTAVGPDALKNKMTTIFESGKIDFFIEVLTYVKYGKKGVCYTCYLSDEDFVDINNYGTVGIDTIIHESCHGFNDIHELDWGAFDEGICITLPKYYLNDQKNMAETVFGTKLYYRDIGIPGYPVNLQIGDPNNYDEKGKQFAIFMMSIDESKINWFNEQQVECIFRKYWEPLNRNINWEEWLRLVEIATQQGIQDSECTSTTSTTLQSCQAFCSSNPSYYSSCSNVDYRPLPNPTYSNVPGGGGSSDPDHCYKRTLVASSDSTTCSEAWCYCYTYDGEVNINYCSPSGTTENLQTDSDILPPGKNWQLKWNDEFEGTRLDMNKWTYRLGTRRDGIWTSENVYLDGNGNVVIRTKFDGNAYTSGAIYTSGKYQDKYGYWVARCKLPKEEGHWPAFWIQSPTFGNPIGNPATAGAEIDVMEYPKRTKEVHHAIHWDGYGGYHKLIQKDVPLSGSLDDYHTFGVEWTPTEYVFYVDGKETWRSTTAISQRTQFLELTDEIGDWAGDITKAHLPDYFICDYVRVYGEV